MLFLYILQDETYKSYSAKWAITYLLARLEYSSVSESSESLE